MKPEQRMSRLLQVPRECRFYDMQALTKSEQLHTNPVRGQVILPLFFLAISSRACHSQKIVSFFNHKLTNLLPEKCKPWYYRHSRSATLVVDSRCPLALLLYSKQVWSDAAQSMVMAMLASGNFPVTMGPPWYNHLHNSI